MMDAEQLKAAYDKGWREAEWQIDGVRHLVVLAEVARQQAEHDAQIVERMSDYWRVDKYSAAIREQFDDGAANPSTTPKETR